MADSKIKLTKADRFKAFLRSYFLLASFNYERMQNGGVAGLHPYSCNQKTLSN